MSTGDTSPASSQCFRRALRLQKRAEFLALQREGTKVTTPHFVILRRSRSNASSSRVGITTSRKVGNAPVRNRVRRLVREFFRKHHTLLANFIDMVVIARPAPPRLRYEEVERELRTALRLNGAK